MHRDDRGTQRTREAGFSLTEMVVVLGIVAVLSAVLLLTMDGSKDQGREQVSLSRMQEARTALQRARDREQMTLQEVIGGAGSAGSCANVDPLPTVDRLGGACRAAWDAVNARLTTYLGTPQAAAALMTDGAGRPILVDAREAGCPGASTDRLIAVHPSGDRGRPQQTVQLDRSGYGC